MIWKNGLASYENQLKNFQNLRNLIESKLEKMHSEQKSLIEKTALYKIDSDSLSLKDGREDELRAALTEIILEGLCWIKPKILARKETGYVSA